MAKSQASRKEHNRWYVHLGPRNTNQTDLSKARNFYAGQDWTLNSDNHTALIKSRFVYNNTAVNPFSLYKSPSLIPYHRFSSVRTATHLESKPLFFFILFCRFASIIRGNSPSPPTINCRRSRNWTRNRSIQFWGFPDELLVEEERFRCLIFRRLFPKFALRFLALPCPSPILGPFLEPDPIPPLQFI